MNDLITTFQDLLAQVPDVAQPLILAIAATVPFIEGEVAAAIGVIGGIHPAVAAVAAALGNFAAVTILVLLGGGVRTAIIDRNGRRGTSASAPSARARKFQRAFERFGVPGVSLLGPALLPTHFTATALVGMGVGRSRVLVWQAVTIALWTLGVTLLATGVIATL